MIPIKENRPWGFYRSLEESENYKVKYIWVDSGHKLSYQTHKYRSEHWFIVSGVALVTINDEQNVMYGGDSVDIPVGTPHRIEALNTPVEFIEVQSGTYFGEDDIVRIEDAYGR
jgi:mannose-6-phosphate isomerase-like protein (cupin superfamily)